MGKKSRLKSNLETILFPSMRSCISGHHTFLDTAPLYAICIQGVMAWFSSTWLLATCVNCVSFSCTSVMSLYRNAVACSSTLLWRIYSWFNLNNNWIFYLAPFFLIASKGFFLFTSALVKITSLLGSSMGGHMMPNTTVTVLQQLTFDYSCNNMKILFNGS